MQHFAELDLTFQNEKDDFLLVYGVFADYGLQQKR